MAQPIRPTGRTATSFNVSVIYYGPLEDCVKLYNERDRLDLDFQLAANSDRGSAQVTITADDLGSRLDFGGVLNQLGEAHQFATDLDLAHSRY